VQKANWFNVAVVDDAKDDARPVVLGRDFFYLFRITFDQRENKIGMVYNPSNAWVEKR